LSLKPDALSCRTGIAIGSVPKTDVANLFDHIASPQPPEEPENARGFGSYALVGVISDRMSSMKDLISIIIPTYNAERFIGRTLGSALNQTFKDIEVIVVNDGSTDKTQFIVEDFVANDGRVRLFNTINRGVATARNFGIENARGAYVAFLDADDLWHPTKIERQFKALSAHVSDSTWAGVYVFHRAIDDEDRVIGPRTGDDGLPRLCTGP
jgi:hypothetical protein